VLVRKASSIAKKESVASWLHGVAYRTALRAKIHMARQHALDSQVQRTPAPDCMQEVIMQDLRVMLDEEVQRLPERYRLPFVLCYMEGKTNEEAAVILGCPKGTILSRLSRAREKLRRRLTRRGLGLSAGLIATMLSQSAVSATVPPALADSTVKAALAVASGAAAAGLLSANVAALTEGVLKAMLLTKLKVTAAMLIGLTLVGVSASAVFGPGLVDNPPQAARSPMPNAKQSPVPKPDADANRGGAETPSNGAPSPKAVEEPSGARPKRSHEVRGVVRDSTGQPAAGVHVYWLGAPSYLKSTVASLPKHGLPSRAEVELLQSGSSDAQGRFSLQAQLDADDRRIADRMTFIIAKAPKHGFGGMRYGSDTKNVEVTLSEEIPIEGRLLMPNGSPAKGVQVRLLSARRTTSIMPEEGWGITSTVWRQGKEYKIPDFPEPVSTDDDGRFRLGGLAQGGEAEVEIRDDRFALEELRIASNSKLTEWITKSFGSSDDLQPKFTHTLQPGRLVQGTVTDKETGKPLADVLVEVMIWLVRSNVHGGHSYYARTDAQGRYRLLGPVPNDNFMAYTLAVHPAPESGYLPVEGEINHPLPAGQKFVEKNFALPKGTLLRGRVIDADSKKPVVGAAVIYEAKQGNPNNRGNLQFYRHPASTDNEGNFTIAGLQGEVYLLVEGPKPDFVRSILSHDETKTGRDRFLHGYAKLDLKGEDQFKPVEIVLRKGVSLEVRVVKPDGTSLPYVTALCRGVGANVNWAHGIGFPEQCEKGLVRLTGLDPERTYRILLINKESRLAAVAYVRADPQAKQPVEVRLQPTGTVRGKVIHADGSPAAHCGVAPYMLVTEDKDPVSRDDLFVTDRFIFQGNFGFSGDRSLSRWQANAKGEFEFDGLMPGVRLILQAGTSNNQIAMKEVTLKSGEVLDAGTLKLAKRKE
ncbi:MAG TPA: sigma factor-like helix-turn-helix DNA-binding protein, partial [Gemmataceae bacterium]|nr:sigma factor-like helix-turn-helix DNA-binding protein [Gemmataceae bacterium]